MSTLDERVGRKARSRPASGARKATTSSRAAQGLPPKIEDDAVLDAAAALLADTVTAMAVEGQANWTREGADHARSA
jgi:hypothetical protein